jgi:hypothetical protein
MKKPIVPDQPLPHLQPSLFVSLSAVRVDPKTQPDERTVNLARLEAQGWLPAGEPEICCMVGGCYRPLMRWRRRKKGKPTQFQYVDVETFVVHDHCEAG